MEGLEKPTGNEAQQTEMDELLEVQSSEKAGEEAPVEAPAPEEKPEEKPVEEKPVEEKKEPTEAEKLAAENQLLRAELNELAKRTGERPAAAPVVVTPPAERPVQPVNQPATPIEFITADEAEGLLDKPQEVLNAVLNKVFQAGREQAMREMPTLVRNQTLTEMTLQQRVQKFWSDNKDLEPYKDFCSMVANQVEVENPGLAFGEVLDKTAETVRTRLNIPKPAAEEEVKPAEEIKEPSLKPALPVSPGSARRPAPTPTPSDAQQKEMEDLMMAGDY